jgi:hypothetical protein
MALPQKATDKTVAFDKWILGLRSGDDIPWFVGLRYGVALILFDWVGDTCIVIHPPSRSKQICSALNVLQNACWRL